MSPDVTTGQDEGAASNGNGNVEAREDICQLETLEVSESSSSTLPVYLQETVAVCDAAAHVVTGTVARNVEPAARTSDQDGRLPAPGDKLLQYQIIRELGRGGIMLAETDESDQDHHRLAV